MSENSINIVFVCDDNYALCTGVAIQSLRNCRCSNRNYNIYVIASNMSENNIQTICSLSDENFAIHIMNAKDVAEHSSVGRIKTAAHVSMAALYKFYIPQMFRDLDKILYIDGDVLIRDDLTELYDIDISNDYAAVCADFGAETYPAPYKRRLNIRHEKYFNSGVMLLNLALLREDNIAEKLIQYRTNGINDYMDQDAFNIVFRERVQYFSFLYNMAISAWIPYPREVLNNYYGLSLPSKASFFTDAKILHFSSPEKPWKNRAIGCEEWLARYIESPFLKQAALKQRSPESDFRKLLEEELEYSTIITGMKATVPDVDNPLISVIVPVYNAEKYLHECIESLMVQTLKQVEFVFVDDGSTDSSLKILQMYQMLDNRISIYQQKNQYAGVARNHGMKHAKGKYITFLDSDDVMLPDALELFYKTAENTLADLVISSAYRFSTNYDKKEVAGWCLRKEFLPYKKVFSAEDCNETLFQITAGAPWGKLYRRSLIEKNNICFPSLPRSEDFCVVYGGMATAKRITTLDAELILYRMIDGSGSLEDAKDRFPLASVDGYRLLWGILGDIGKQDYLHKTFVNCIVSGVANCLRTFKAGESFCLMAECLKEEIVPQYNINLSEYDYFCFKGDWAFLNEICIETSPAEFLFKKYKAGMGQKTIPTPHLKSAPSKETKSYEKEYRFYEKEVGLIRKSFSYRIGRFITFIPRKIRGGIRCYQEHGMRYTLNRLLVHLHLKKDSYR